MVTIKELLKLNKLKNFRLIAGTMGLDSIVSNIVIYEYEQIKQEYEHYYERDFILTTLIYAKENPELVEVTLLNLLEQGIVGMAIKSVHFQSIPESVINMADKKNIPIFMFDEIYMEDIIICVSNYIMNRQNYSAYENEISDMLTLSLRENEITKYARNMNSQVFEQLSVLYIDSAHREVKETIASILLSLSYKNQQQNYIKKFVFEKYRRGLFIIGNFQNIKSRYSNIEVKEKFQKLFRVLDCQIQDVTIGQSNVITEIKDFGKCIREAYYSNKVGILNDEKWMMYEDIGINKVLFPMLNETVVCDYYETIIRQIEIYDESYQYCLLSTMVSYVGNDFEISKTAALLFQHANTIRYRLTKIKSVIDCKSETDFKHILYLTVKYLELKEVLKL